MHVLIKAVAFDTYCAFACIRFRIKLQLRNFDGNAVDTKNAHVSMIRECNQKTYQGNRKLPSIADFAVYLYNTDFFRNSLMLIKRKKHIKHKTAMYYTNFSF
ncbi:hypothetical protein MIDIC_170036 [Alphaproteobacteria bacterium]